MALLNKTNTVVTIVGTVAGLIVSGLFIYDRFYPQEPTPKVNPTPPIYIPVPVPAPNPDVHPKWPHKPDIWNEGTK